MYFLVLVREDLRGQWGPLVAQGRDTMELFGSNPVTVASVKV